MNKIPLVYIIMPCYNGEKYLLEQLMSIYYQKYTNRYLIFVNDGSVDKSESIVKDFVSHYNLYEKVKIIDQENDGVNSAINKGLEEVKKMCDIHNSDSLISYCDSDDIWTREKLLVQVEYMLMNPNCGLSYHDVSIVDESSRIITQSMLKNIYYKGESFFVVACFGVHFYSTEMMFRIKYIDNIFPLPVGFTIGQDLWTGLVLSILNIDIGFINKQLAYYRRGHDSLSSKSKGIENARQRVNYFLLVGEKTHMDVSYEYNYYTQRWINRPNKGYSFMIVLLLMLLKFPRVFFVYVKVFFYEKLFIRFF